MPVSIRQSIILSLLLFFCIAAAAQRHEHYYIVFSARDASIRPFSLGGHAIISWGYRDDHTSVVCSEKSLGFYPGEGRTKIQATVASRRGRLVKGYFANGKGLYMQQLTVEVDSLIWVNSQKEAAKWDYQTYNFFSRNCLHFMHRIAGEANLKCPHPHTFLFRLPLRPVKYVRRLYRKNKKRAVFFDEMQFDLKG